MPQKRKREVTIASMTEAIMRGDASWVEENLRNQEGVPYHILFHGMFPFFLHETPRPRLKRTGSAVQLAIVCALRNPDEWDRRIKIFQTLASIQVSRNTDYHDQRTLEIIFGMERHGDETFYIRMSEMILKSANISVALTGLKLTIREDFPETMKLWLDTFKKNRPSWYEINHVFYACISATHERAFVFFREMCDIFCKQGRFMLCDVSVLYAVRNNSPHAAPMLPMLLNELRVSPQSWGRTALSELGPEPKNPIQKAKVEILKWAMYRTDPVNLVAYAIQAAMGGFYKAEEDRIKEKKSMLSEFELGVVQMIVKYCLE